MPRRTLRCIIVDMYTIAGADNSFAFAPSLQALYLLADSHDKPTSYGS